ncbi:hypothetical protein ACL02U_11745 [Streptomyces sp. MS06]|uniref:hypothetical protein n=1 Tax=Streptomyces sp. MS06 TaxID=3385974 RepID=UPI0039A275F8
MATQQSSTTTSTAGPLRTAASALRRVPGVRLAGRVAGGTLDKVGAVSPRGRRLAVYTGAGVLGVTGVVEWPVAVTGAAVAWLTRPRPAGSDRAEQASAPEHGAAAGGEGEAAPSGARSGSGSTRRTSSGGAASRRTRSASAGKSADGKSADGKAAEKPTGQVTGSTGRKTTAGTRRKTTARTARTSTAGTGRKTTAGTRRKPAAKSAAKPAARAGARAGARSSGSARDRGTA